jgi:hypothetical protein
MGAILGHRNEQGSPLNSACYMWWDFDLLVCQAYFGACSSDAIDSGH